MPWFSSIDWLIDWLRVVWLIGLRSIDWLIRAWLIDWVWIDWLIKAWLIDWVSIDWLIVRAGFSPGSLRLYLFISPYVWFTVFAEIVAPGCFFFNGKFRGAIISEGHFFLYFPPPPLKNGVLGESLFRGGGSLFGNHPHRAIFPTVD